MADAKPPVVLWIPGALVNPQGTDRGGTWHKRARLARSIRERVAMHVLAVVGRRAPWPASTPKVVAFVAYVANAYDDDNLRLALKPYLDALTEMKLINDDRVSAGHRVVYQQITERGKLARRGVEISVEPLASTRTNDDR